MSRSYSLDLRVRVIAFVEAGHSRRAAAVEALWQAIGEICDLFEPQECWNFSKPPDMRPRAVAAVEFTFAAWASAGTPYQDPGMAATPCRRGLTGPAPKGAGEGAQL